MRHGHHASPCLFLSKNSAQIVLLGSAMSTCGIPFNGIDYTLDIEVIKSIIQEMKVKSIFITHEFYNKLLCLSSACNLIIIDEYVNAAISECNDCYTKYESNIQRKYNSYAFTSGTTGVPKIVFRTKSFDVKRFAYLNNRYGFDSNDVHLVCLPMYHVSSTGWLRQFLSLGYIVHEYYGTTETGVNTLLDPKDTFYRQGSVGREFEGNEIAILDHNNMPIPVSVTGRIAIHSYMNMEDYLNANADFIDIDGKKFLLTSDYGYKNSDGYLFVIQRAQGSTDHVYNFYAIENDIFNLCYVSDVFVFRSSITGQININIVTKGYRPYSEIKKDVESISNQYGVKNVLVNILTNLDYTMTGKMKLSQQTVSA